MAVWVELSSLMVCYDHQALLGLGACPSQEYSVLLPSVQCVWAPILFLVPSAVYNLVWWRYACACSPCRTIISFYALYRMCGVRIICFKIRCNFPQEVNMAAVEHLDIQILVSSLLYIKNKCHNLFLCLEWLNAPLKCKRIHWRMACAKWYCPSVSLCRKQCYIRQGSAHKCCGMNAILRFSLHYSTLQMSVENLSLKMHLNKWCKWYDCTLVHFKNKWKCTE